MGSPFPPPRPGRPCLISHLGSSWAQKSLLTGLCWEQRFILRTQLGPLTLRRGSAHLASLPLSCTEALAKLLPCLDPVPYLSNGVPIPDLLPSRGSEN